MPGSPSDLTIVVAVRDDPAIARCLASINDTQVNTLVVMNDPSAEVRRLVARSGHRSLTLNRAGLAAACNAGVQASLTDYVLFTDSDCVFRPDCIARFVDSIGAAPLVRGWVAFRGRTPAERVVARYRTIHTNTPKFVCRVPLMIDRKAISAVGGYLFDERLPWTEDFELSARIEDAGLHVERVRDAVVIHDPIPLVEDVRKATLYGLGHHVGRSLGLSGYRAIKWAGGIRAARSLYLASHSIGLAAYSFLFETAFCVGYFRGSVASLSRGLLIKAGIGRATS